MDARQLRCVAAIRGLGIAACMTMSMPAAWAADELKLPETPDEYRQLLMESSKSENEGRSGKVYHIAQVSTVVKAQAVAPNPTVTNAVGGSPGVQPVPLIGKNLDRAKEKDSRKMGYQIAVRWSDGSIGVFEQEDLNGLREGDPVVVHGQSVERDPSR